MNLILIGFKRAGKTTYGKMLAQALKVPFIDTDAWIIEAYRKSSGEAKEIHEIYSLLKEPEFRALEQKIILGLKINHAVISVGGGAVLSPFNREYLSSLGKCVYLKQPKEEVMKALSLGRIPSYLDQSLFQESFEKMYQQRAPIFEGLASESVEVFGKSQQEVLSELIAFAQNNHIFS